MEWLLCNNCNLKIAESKSPFSLTQCGHLFCSKCIPHAIKQCFICKTVNLKTVLLQEPLMPSIEHYFAPISDSLKTLQTCVNFQNSQMRYLLNRFNDIEKKYVFAKKALFETEKKASKYKHEIKQMEKKYEKLKKNQTEVLKTMTVHRPSYCSVSSTNSSQQNLMNISDRQSSVYLTPLSASNQSSQCSSRSNDRLSQPLVYEGPFLVPNITKVLRSGGNKSTPKTPETPMQMLKKCHIKTPQKGFSSSWN